MLVESQKKLSGNDRFEGFTMDLATELSKLLYFNFTFKLVSDGAVSHLHRRSNFRI
jgi:ionotropic glutamate receptor